MIVVVLIILLLLIVIVSRDRGGDGDGGRGGRLADQEDSALQVVRVRELVERGHSLYRVGRGQLRDVPRQRGRVAGYVDELLEATEKGAREVIQPRSGDPINRWTG